MSWFSSLVGGGSGSSSSETASSSTGDSDGGEGVSIAKIGSFFSGIATTIKTAIENEENKLIAEKEKTERAAQADADIQDVLECHRVICPPWEDLPRDIEPDVLDNVRKQILSLPKNKRNFMENPPSDVNFEFNYDEYLPVCIASLKDDPQLERIRFYLVPQYIREQRFWRNYFYRVKIIKEAHGIAVTPLPKVESSKAVSTPKQLEPSRSTSNAHNAEAQPATPEKQLSRKEIEEVRPKPDDEAIALEGIHNEFISDELDSKAMKAWEEELKAELESFSDGSFEFDQSTDLDLELSEKINKELGI